MSNNSRDDRWLLPRRQTELPARGLLPEAMLHHRREVTFLALAAVFLVASAALAMIGMTRVVDVSALLAGVAPGLSLPTALLLPLGVLPFFASLLAGAFAVHLFGRSRAVALVITGAIAMVATVGLMRLADVIDGGDAFGASLAFAAAYVVGHASNVLVFERLRGRSVIARIVIAAIVANVLAWSAFAGVLQAGAGYVLPLIAPDTVIALAVGSAACSLALVLVLAIPAALAARALATALRVGRDLFADNHDPFAAGTGAGRPARESRTPARRLPPALIIDGDDELPPQRARRPSLQPFSSAEMRFFSEGDLLGE